MTDREPDQQREQDRDHEQDVLGLDHAVDRRRLVRRRGNDVECGVL